MKLGEYQDLIYIKRVDFGVYLAESKDSQEKVLLPAKQVPPDVKPGDRVHVFLYKDSWIGDWRRICFFHIRR